MLNLFVLLEKEIGNYSLNFDIKSKPYKDNIIEVDTTLKMVPIKMSNTKSYVKLLELV